MEDTGSAAKNLPNKVKAVPIAMFIARSEADDEEIKKWVELRFNL